MTQAVRNIIKAVRHHYQRWRIKTHPHRYLVTYEVGGQPIKYLTWDYNQVWRWTRSHGRATRFTSETAARLSAQSTSMPDQYRYTIRRIPR